MPKQHSFLVIGRAKEQNCAIHAYAYRGVCNNKHTHTHTHTHRHMLKTTTKGKKDNKSKSWKDQEQKMDNWKPSGAGFWL